MPRKRLVIGFGTNMPSASVEVFCRSAREAHDPDLCDVAVVTNRFEPHFAALETEGVRFLSTSSTYSRSTGRTAKALNRMFLHPARLVVCNGLVVVPEDIRLGYFAMLEAWHHPQFARWFAFERILRASGGYEAVFLADVKDVVFQGDAFADHRPGTVVLYGDVGTFAEEEWNRGWYRDAYGARAMEAVLDRTPVCIGTIEGACDEVRGMIRKFCERIAASPFGKIEQAIFNRMLIEGAFGPGLSVIPNGDGAVAHVGGLAAPLYALREGKVIRLSDGRKPAVVHMYDRDPEARAHFVRRYAST